MFKTPQVCFWRMQLISWQNLIAVFTKVHKGHNFSSHAFSVDDSQAVNPVVYNMKIIHTCSSK